MYLSYIAHLLESRQTDDFSLTGTVARVSIHFPRCLRWRRSELAFGLFSSYHIQPSLALSRLLWITKLGPFLPCYTPQIRYDIFPLTIVAFTWNHFGPFYTLLLPLTSSSGPLRLLTQFLSIQSRFCLPAPSTHWFAPVQLASASGSSDQRPQRTTTS